MPEPDLNALLDALEAHLEATMPEGVGYAIVLMGLDSGDTCLTANVCDADLVETLRDAADEVAAEVEAFAEPVREVSGAN